jgi:hypothetical protein
MRALKSIHRWIIFIVMLGSFFLSSAASLNWQKLAGPYGGPGYGMGNVVSDDNSTLYTLVANVGVYLSRNNGQSWQMMSNQGLTQLLLEQIVYFNHSLYVIGNDDSIYQYNASNNAWLLVQSGGDVCHNSDCVTGFYNYNNNLYAYSVRDEVAPVLSVSSDGLHWATANITVPGHVTQSFVIAKDGTFYIQTTGGLYKSTDLANTWQFVSDTLPKTDELYNKLFAVEINGKESLFMGTTSAYKASMYLYRSDDGGKTWIGISTLGQRLTYAMLQQGNTLYVGTDRGLFASTDGATWSIVDASFASLDIVNISVANNQLFVGTYSNVYTRKKDGSWIQTDTGINAVNISNLVSFKDGTLLATSEEALYQSKDNGATWSISEAGLVRNASPRLWNFASDATTGMTYVTWGDINESTIQLYSSADQGTNWQNLSSSLSYVTDIAASAGHTYASSVMKGVCELTNGSWGCYKPASVQADKIYSSNGELYAFDYGGALAKIDIAKQKDVEVTGDICQQISCQYQLRGFIGVPNGTRDNLYLATDLGLWAATYTPSVAVTWHNMSPNVAGKNYTNISALLVNGNQIIAATPNDGVFISNDLGRSWSAAGLSGVNIQNLVINKNMLLAGTGTGIYTASLS